MKKTVLVSALGLIAFAASAQEVGQVISSVPVIQQVAVPRQVCNPQPVAVEQPTSGGGAVIGAIVGGLVGNQFGHGTGRAAATAVGMMGGAMVGNTAEAQGQQRQVQNMPQCTTQTYYENRTVGYNVTYEYAGKQYQAQLPYDPGPTIRLQVTPMGSGRPAGPGQSFGPAPVTAPPVIYGPQTLGSPEVMDSPTVLVPSTMVAPVVYARPYPYYYAPPVSFSIGLGYWGHSHYRHRI
jgi:uncharacterized protein YcfJ